MREREIPFNPTHLNPRQQKQISHGEASSPRLGISKSAAPQVL
jgi:hypothetical protein